jgi:hypothetical protein
MMLLRLCRSWKAMQKGFIKRENIFKMNTPDFELLKNLEEYNNFVTRCLADYYEIIENYE